MSYLATARWGMGRYHRPADRRGGQSVAVRPWDRSPRTAALAPIAAALSISVPVLGAIIGAAILAAGYAIDPS